MTRFFVLHRPIPSGQNTVSRTSSSPICVETGTQQAARSFHTTELQQPLGMPASTRHFMPVFSRLLISIPTFADANLRTLITPRGFFVMANSGDTDPAAVLTQGGSDPNCLFELLLINPRHSRSSTRRDILHLRLPSKLTPSVPSRLNLFTAVHLC